MVCQSILPANVARYLASGSADRRINLSSRSVLRPPVLRVLSLLTEQEVAKIWRNLFQRAEFTEEIFTRAEVLIDELRPESPLRHRLGSELTELRKRHRIGDAV